MTEPIADRIADRGADPSATALAADVCARVLAWHHRHPLARRLQVGDVHSIGYVALPFADAQAGTAVAPAAAPEPAAGSLRERAMARAQATQAAQTAAPAVAAVADPVPATATGPLPAAFDEDLLPPLSLAAVADFARAHGSELSHEPTGVPVRRLLPRPATPGPAWRWLLTAELRDGTARTRVLLGPAAAAPVLGKRLWSLRRVGGLAALGGALVAAAVLAWLEPAAWPGPVEMPVPQAAAPATASSPMAASAPAAEAMPLDAAASAALAEPAASAPDDVAPRLGRIDLPSLGPLIDERRRQAAEQRAAASAADAASAPAAVQAPAVAAPPAPAASAPAFALTTRLMRTRTESQQTAEALRSLLIAPGSPVQQVDVLPVGDDFRVVGWPFPSRAAAEKAQAGLAARGLRLQVIEF